MQRGESDRVITEVREAFARGEALGHSAADALRGTADPVVLEKVGKTVRACMGQLAEHAHAIRVRVAATYTAVRLADIVAGGLAGVGRWAGVELDQYAAADDAWADEAHGGRSEVFVFSADASHFAGVVPPVHDLKKLRAMVMARTSRLADQAVALCAARPDLMVVLHTVPLPSVVYDMVISASAKAELSRLWADLNCRLLDMSAQHQNLHCVDLYAIAADAPFPVHDARLRSFADMPYTLGVLGLLGHYVARLGQAGFGRQKKVLAVDLDNTLWGGVLGEEGAEGIRVGGAYPGKAYREFQQAIAELRAQGVVIVAASKNDADHARQVLAEHPDMVLRPEMFSVLGVGWDAKASTLQHAASSLGLALNSFVFADDSEIERSHVESIHPDVRTIDTSGDPGELMSKLLTGGWFDNLTLTETDRSRPELYRANAARTELAAGFASDTDFLKALGIVVKVEDVDHYLVPRVAQLAGRTNQFNLTGLRPDEAATASMVADPNHDVLTVSVRDSFTDEGVVGAAWLRRDDDVCEVLNLVLSCRVLGRGIEHAVLHAISHRARRAGVRVVRGDFVPSDRNSVAKDVYPNFGFVACSPTGYELRLDAGDISDAPKWIEIETEDQP